MTALVARSLLFVPATRPDMVAKVARSRPDVVVLDLEDAVAPGEKDSARSTAADTLATERPGAGTVLLRINAPGTPWYDDDVRTVVDLLSGGHVDGAVLPMYETPDQMRALRDAIGDGARVVAGLESVRGIADARELLAAAPDAVYFGAEDFAASIGGRRTTAGTEVLFARSRVALFAALHGVVSLDQVVTAVRDADAFRAEARQALDLGFRGKVCLHPVQVEVAHEVFTPTADEVAHAREILAAGEGGVGVVNGEMVDAVHLTMARTVLARAGEAV